MKVGANLCMPANPWLYKSPDIGLSKTAARNKTVLFEKLAVLQQKIHIQ